MGILMAANVWMIIWKNQKVVLANAANVLGGGEANADAPTAGRKALLASRQNMIFSVSMLFFMVGAAHFYNAAFEMQQQQATPGRSLQSAMRNHCLARIECNRNLRWHQGWQQNVVDV